MLNSTSPAGSDTEAELAHTLRHTHDVSGYESDSASLIGTLSRRPSHPSRMSVMSMSSDSSGSSLFTLTPEPMGFQARRKRAAKLTNFFGATYRDLFGEVLEKLEIGFLEEARQGNMSREEMDVCSNWVHSTDHWVVTNPVTGSHGTNQDSQGTEGRELVEFMINPDSIIVRLTISCSPPHMTICLSLGSSDYYVRWSPCTLVSLWTFSLVTHLFHRTISADCDKYCGFPMLS
jgi:hypothetical protein